MRIALAQINPTVGDVPGNLQLILQAAEAARALGADILLTPELALSGAQPADLLLRPAFLQACSRAIGTLIDQVDGITLVIGHPRAVGNECVNCASVIRNGNLLGRYEKMLLSNTGAFDEVRYFTPGAQPLLFEQSGVEVALAISEDIKDVDVVGVARDEGAQLLLVMNAAPFHLGVAAEREALLAQRVAENALPAISVNCVGGQDEWIFDGQSFALNHDGERVLQMAAFQPGLAVIDFANDDLQISAAQVEPPTEHAEATGLWQALQLGLRDQVRKNGYAGAMLSGFSGLNDTLLLALASDTLGAEQVFIASDDAAPAKNQLRLNSADKSELAGGTPSVEGDYAPFRDLSATQLRVLAAWRVYRGGDLSGLLLDALAVAPTLTGTDAILHFYLQERLSIAEIAAPERTDASAADIEHIIQAYHANASLRRRAPIGPRLSSSAEGVDIRLPASHQFKQ